MSLGTLWTIPYQVSGKYIRAAAAIGGLQIDLPESYKHYEDNKKPEFLAKFPHGKIPAWEGKDGFFLTESYAIGRYISSLAPNAHLLGTTPEETALVDQWSNFASSEIGVFTGFSSALIKVPQFPYNKATHQKFIENERRALNTLNAHLASRTFLVGERITLADLVVAATVQVAFGVNIGAAERAELPHVVRFVETVVNQPAIKSIFEGAEYTEKALKYTPPPKEKN